jgi:urocanate hydratase
LLAVLEEMAKMSPEEIQQQMQDNIQWIRHKKINYSRFTSPNFYADAEGRVKLPKF